MSARTRAQIKALVESHTGRAKDTLENSLCDSALWFALQRYSFRDAQSVPSDIAITEDATSVSIAAITGLVNIVTARIVEASGSRNAPLILKPRTWWDTHVVNSEDEFKGWPMYGMREGSVIQLNRPAESGLELRLRVTTEQTFATDATVCPIACLNLFVEHYVTAMIFKDIEQEDSYRRWMNSAVGAKYLIDGTVGGELANAIAVDSMGDTAESIQSEPPMLGARDNGIAIQNLIEGHDDYGNTRNWY